MSNEVCYGCDQGRFQTQTHTLRDAPEVPNKVNVYYPFPPESLSLPVSGVVKFEHSR